MNQKNGWKNNARITLEETASGHEV